ncbi:multidrug effflux MFS transporter [Brachybacterium sp. DNPG3]
MSTSPPTASAIAASVAPADAAAPPSAPISIGLLAILGLLSAAAPLATDLYLPAFPEMTTDLGTGASQVQLTLTAFLAGLTIGQLVFGPLSDRTGRRLPLLVGSALFVVASIAATFAPTVGLLIAARLVQGLAGAAGMVLARAIVSDLAQGPAAARAFSLMMIIGGVAPVVAPVMGGVLTGVIGWRGLLGIVLALSAIMLVAVVAGVRESLPPARRAELLAARRDSGSALDFLRDRAYLAHALCFGFAFAVMMAYISASPFVYQDLMGFSTVGYGLAFGVNAIALMIVSAISAQRVTTVGPDRMLRMGLAAIGISALAILALVLLGAPSIWLMVPLFTAISSMGLIFGNATALALGAVPQAAGTASAVLGAFQFGLGALVSPLVSLGSGITALPLAIVMVCCAALAVLSLLLLGRRSAA